MLVQEASRLQYTAWEVVGNLGRAFMQVAVSALGIRQQVLMQRPRPGNGDGPLKLHPYIS